MLKRIVISTVLVVLASLYLFPFSFAFFPEGLNTKMILAVLGICFFVYDRLQYGSFTLSKVVLISTLFAVAFSVWCLFCIVENSTTDTTYTRYWISFATWLGGGYAICFLIRRMTGRLDLENLTFYLAWVCFIQCILAIMIDNMPAFQSFVDRNIIQGQDFYHRIHRLYGIGASLDTAGVRFSVIMVLMAHQLSRWGSAMQDTFKAIFYFVAFAVIVVIGSIIARTTWVGAIAGLLYMFVANIHTTRGVMSGRQVTFWLSLAGVILVTVAVSAYLYGHNPSFRANLRFGFEGFFRWAETGVFRTDSTDKLNGIMWVWPKDTRSWIIGTGLFEDWVYGTDIGYCRFTLYCGLVGMVLFSIFFIYMGIAINSMFEDIALLSVFLIALAFVIWFKVATDIFFVYAMLFCLNSPVVQQIPSECTSSTT